jgi:RNA polymerase sigma-70 factor (ECF subfamily)
MVERSNVDWVSELRSTGPSREAALADLRTIIVSGLRFGLAGRLDTSGPEFAPLAEDVAQETLLKSLAHLESFEGRSRFTTWVHKIAVRVALTELRRRRWKDVSLDTLMDADTHDSSPKFMADPATGPDKAMDQADILARINQMMQEELTDKQMRAMMAVAMQGLPLEEVARRLDMERNALYKLLHDARLKLKRRLSREGLTPGELLAMFESK